MAEDPLIQLYIALGDSMSIDRYPSLDLLARQPSAADTIVRRGGRRSARGGDLPVGAASLLTSNVDELWPAFAGRDLATLAAGAECVDLTMDGAVVPDVTDAQLPAVPATDAPALVTMTMGGNDLLTAYGHSRSLGALDRAVGEIVRDYERCVDLVRARLPRALLVLTTVYDPSDGTGFIPGFHETGPALPLQMLHRLNAHIHRIAGARDRAVVADVHAHFLGHGARAEPFARWFWGPSMIEPGVRGASEIRAVWLAAAGFAAGRVAE